MEKQKSKAKAASPYTSIKALPDASPKKEAGKKEKLKKQDQDVTRDPPKAKAGKEEESPEKHLEKKIAKQTAKIGALKEELAAMLEAKAHADIITEKLHILRKEYYGLLERQRTLDHLYESQGLVGHNSPSTATTEAAIAQLDLFIAQRIST